jgi:hypothetical protein
MAARKPRYRSPRKPPLGGKPAFIRELTTPPLDDRQRSLLLLLEPLADLVEAKPGIVTRAVMASVRAALARIPTLTPKIVAKPRMAVLVERLGLTPELLEKGRQAARDPPTPEMDALGRLWAKARHTTLAPEMVAKAFREPPEREVLRRALAHRASQLGMRGAAARHASDNEMRQALPAFWTTGKYSTKKICAEEECEALKMSLETARKALRHAPDPDPWPAKALKYKAK